MKIKKGKINFPSLFLFAAAWEAVVLVSSVCSSVFFFRFLLFHFRLSFFNLHLFQNISSFHRLKSFLKMMPMPCVVRLVLV